MRIDPDLMKVMRRGKWIQEQNKRFEQNPWNYYALQTAVIIAVTSVILFFIFVCSAYSSELDLTKAVIHHTDSHDVSAKTIDQWHKERGWDGIGYHFVIRQDGSIEKGRSLERKGAHARSGRAYSRNDYIGIVLTGRNIFSRKQTQALKSLLRDLDVKHIEDHHEECPGRGLYLPEIARELGIEYDGITRYANVDH